MDKLTRRAYLTNRWKTAFSKRSRFITSTVALAALSLDTAEDSVIGTQDSKRRIGQTVKERATDDSIADCDKVEATVSKLEFESDTDSHGWSGGSTLLTKSERARLAKEVAPYKAFKADVRALPLLLTA